MKLAEIITVLCVVFFVTLTVGDGAPQWRPQGRFGKRGDQRQYPLSWQPDSESDIDVYPVVERRSDTESDSEKTLKLLEKLCVESSLPGLFRCYRRKRSAAVGEHDRS
nr:luqin [Mizuhopecten yessoensis]